VGGAGGGLDGPARGLYPAASEQLQKRGIASLRLHYRKPNELGDCVLDTLAGVAFLAREGATRVAVVGHSFGGAVVISAGASSPNIKAVVPMSSQTFGTELTSAVAPRAMLLIHGTNDTVLSDRCSRQIYAAAREPKEIKLYPAPDTGSTRCGRKCSICSSVGFPRSSQNKDQFSPRAQRLRALPCRRKPRHGRET
jgi:dienelactone hydrolase